MHLKPPGRKPRLLLIRKIPMIRAHHADEMRIRAHAQVILDVAEDDLDHGVAVGDVARGEMPAVEFAKEGGVEVGGVVLLRHTKKRAD